MGGGQFKGGLGHDRVRIMVGGIFSGASGADWASVVQGTSVFKAGRGSDRAASVFAGGKVNGARGDDRVATCLYDGGTFNGGPGHDAAIIGDNTPTLTSVEGQTIAACRP
jgi:hypothetical protein